MKYGLISIKAMILDGELYNVLSYFNSYIDFLDYTWFYDGESDENMEEYISKFEPIIIEYFNNKNGY